MHRFALVGSKRKPCKAVQLHVLSVSKPFLIVRLDQYGCRSFRKHLENALQTKTYNTAAVFFHTGFNAKFLSHAALALRESGATVNLLLQTVSSSEVGNEQERHATHMIAITVHFLPQDASSP